MKKIAYIIAVITLTAGSYNIAAQDLNRCVANGALNAPKKKPVIKN